MIERRLAVIYAASAAAILAIILLWSSYGRTAPRPVPGSSGSRWTFNHRKDARNLGLSDEQCDIAFPKLYTELDRARDHLGRDSIQQDQIKIWSDDRTYSHGQVHVLIHHGQMYILGEKRGECDRSRAIGGLSNLYRAIIAVPDPTAIPDVEFVIDIEDTPTENAPSDRIIWAWTRPMAELNTWVMPDFDGWAFPDADLGSYVSFRERLQFYESSFTSKIPKAVWRGSMNNPIRKALIVATEGKDWADVQLMRPETRMHMAEFCAYQFPVHTEGNSWSGRLRYLQNCESIPIMHDVHHMAHYYNLLESDGDNQNYIHVQDDFSDLEEKISFYRAHLALAERLANNSVATFRDKYLTPAAEACYWRRMIRNWAEVQAFEPKAYEDAVGEHGFRKQRGIDWEVWMNPDPNFPI